MTASEEATMLRGCRDGKPAAQRMLYERYAGKMYALSRRYCKNEDEAKDVLQEGFIKVFTNIERFRGECPLEFWVRKIIVNTALNHLRSQRRMPLFVVEPAEIPNAPTDDPIINHYDTEELMSMIRALPTGYQVVFNLYAIEGYAHKEIAELLNISEGTSKSQYARARAAIRERLVQKEAAFS